MKTTYIIFSFVLALVGQISTSYSADTLTFSGVYQGKNLIAQNSFNPSTKSYCTQEIYINDVKSGVNTNQAAFEIDLSALKKMDRVEIKIVRSADCDFKLINSNVIANTHPFAITSISAHENGIAWTVDGESPKGKYFIERLEYGSWQTVHEFTAQSHTGLSLNATISHLSGSNTYRIKYSDPAKIYFSEQVVFASSLAPLVIKIDAEQKKASLSRVAEFKIIDFGGEEIKHGKGTEINFSDLNSGTYFIQSDNKTVKIKIPYTE